MFVDSHCHLDRLDLSPYQGELGAAIAAANERGVTRMLCISTDRHNAERVIDIADQYDGIYASVGIHPLDLTHAPDENDKQALMRLAANPRVIAIGETGLDYYYSKDTIDAQQESFRQHLQLSSALNKPVVVHTRNARDDTIAIIKESANSDVGGVLHCFTETREMAEQALDLNFFIAFSGITTFKNARALRDVVRFVPTDRMLIETDSPYLAPVPYRGKKNEPKYVVEVAQCIAELKGISVNELARITSDNFDRLFLRGSTVT